MRRLVSLAALAGLAAAIALAPGCSESDEAANDASEEGGGERIGVESSYDDQDYAEPAPEYADENPGSDLSGEDDVDDLSGADIPAEEEDASEPGEASGDDPT